MKRKRGMTEDEIKRAEFLSNWIKQLRSSLFKFYFASNDLRRYINKVFEQNNVNPDVIHYYVTNSIRKRIEELEDELRILSKGTVYKIDLPHKSLFCRNCGKDTEHKKIIYEENLGDPYSTSGPFMRSRAFRCKTCGCTLYNHIALTLGLLKLDT